ncbi:MAG: hypothetical protein P9M06_06240 [Candidatus Saelkia tenebricola]|nr:hypothetical protein [Candidatus Saelkia tenebricola]
MKNKKILLILIIIVLILIGMELFCSNFVQARRIQDIEIKTADKREPTTEYIKIGNNWLPLRVTDSNGNLLEEYSYFKFARLSEYPQKVRFRNIKTGGWIELEEFSGVGYYILLDGKNIGVVDWHKIDNNIIKISNIDIETDNTKGSGIGLSIVNWIAKWAKETQGIGKIAYITQNPLMLNILDEVSEVYSETYNYCRELEYKGVPVNRRLEVLIDCSYFYIEEKGDTDTFQATDYTVSIENGSVSQSNWKALPEGAHLERLDVLPDWTITLDGEEIGQVKRFDELIAFLGVTQPIRILIDKEGKIIRY